MATNDDYSYTHDAETDPSFVQGNLEDWSDTIWNISPTKIAFLNTIKRTSTDSIEHKWMTEILKDPNAKASAGKAQGSSASPSEEKRYECKNYTMIFDDSAYVSASQEKTLKVGVKSELNHQITNKMIVLRQSVELRGMAGVYYRKPKAGTAAGVAQGMPGLTGLFGDITLHFDGTTRAYGTTNTVNINTVEEDFEDDTANSKYGYKTFKDALQGVWNVGAEVSQLFIPGTDKAYVSEWDIASVDRQSMKIEKITEKVDMVTTDFGTVYFQAHRNLVKDATPGTFDGTTGDMVTDFGLLFDPAYFSLKMFRDFQTSYPADATDGTTKRGLVEFTFESETPHGIVIFNFSGVSPNTPIRGLPTTAAGYALAY